MWSSSLLPLCLPLRKCCSSVKSGVCSTSCIFISLTSGSIFGFSSPAAAVARHTSEDPKVGQPLPSLHWWLSPGLEGGILQGHFFWGGGGLGEEARPQGMLRLAACSSWHPLQKAQLPQSPHSTAPGNSGMQTISIRKKLTGIPQFTYCQKWMTSAPPPSVSQFLSTPGLPSASSPSHSLPDPQFLTSVLQSVLQVPAEVPTREPCVV